MKTHLPALLSTALLALSLTAPLPVSAAPAEVLSSMKVDHRGLLEIPGVLRGSNDHHWGAANLIAFGPGWQYSAQDWALADTQKTGDSLEARLKVGGAQVRVAQRWGMKTRADGSKGMEMTWRLFNPEQKPMGLERAYVTFPLATDDWGGCTIEADGKTLELIERTLDRPGSTAHLDADKQRPLGGRGRGNEIEARHKLPISSKM